MLSDLVFRLRSLFRRNTVEAELDDELRFHFEQQVEKCIRSELTAVIPASLFANLQPTAGEFRFSIRMAATRAKQASTSTRWRHR